MPQLLVLCMISCAVSSSLLISLFCFFFFNDTATTEIYTLSLHDALPISALPAASVWVRDLRREASTRRRHASRTRSEEHTSELQSLAYLVCRLLLEKKKKRLYVVRIHGEVRGQECVTSTRLHVRT